MLQETGVGATDNTNNYSNSGPFLIISVILWDVVLKIAVGFDLQSCMLFVVRV